MSSSWLFHLCLWGCWRFTPQSSAASSAESSFNTDLWNWFPQSWKHQTLVLVFGKLQWAEHQHHVTSPCVLAWRQWQNVTAKAAAAVKLAPKLLRSKTLVALSQFGFANKPSGHRSSKWRSPASKDMFLKEYIWLNCLSGGLTTDEGELWVV